MTESTTAANGDHTSNGVPTYASVLTPHIVVSPASAAVEFYKENFGATVLSIMEMNGVVAHADLRLNGAGLTLSDPLEEYNLATPAKDAPVNYSIALYVPDVDVVVKRAVDAGATLREPVNTFVSGDRYGSVLDPFGVRWSIMTRVHDVSAEESERRVSEWAASMATSSTE